METSSEQSHPKYKGDVARLVSRVVQVPRVCFSLYFHMYGERMGSLRVNARFKNGSEINQWSIDGNQDNRWNKAQISIETVEDFQVGFTKGIKKKIIIRQMISNTVDFVRM